MARNRGEGSGIRPRAAFHGIIGLLSSLCLSTCGIETVSIFSPPVFVSTGANDIKFQHDTANAGANFSGYELYYRAFDTPDAAQKALDTIQGAINMTTATPDRFVSSNGLFATQGFTRVFDADGLDGVNENGSGIRPLFTVTTAEQGIAPGIIFDLFLDSTQSAVPLKNWFFKKSSDLATQIEVTRSINSSGNQPVSFEDSYSNGPDFTSATGAGSASGTIYFVFFAVAYGVDTSSTSFANNYSLPMSFLTPISYVIP